MIKKGAIGISLKKLLAGSLITGFATKKVIPSEDAKGKKKIIPLDRG